MAEWRVGHQGRDQMYYEELHSGAWQRIEIQGEMLMGVAHHVIYFASPTQWQEYPEWARHRRDEIIARIKQEFRPPDYEYHDPDVGGGMQNASASASVRESKVDSIPAPRAPTVNATPGAATATRAPTQGMGALKLAIVLMMLIGGAMSWVVARGVSSGETSYPSKRATLARTVVRAQEPALYWASLGVYSLIAGGALSLALWGMRERRRLV